MKETNFAQLVSKFKDEFAELHCTLMEVCGTHTHEIRRAGIHQLLPKGVRLLSGPGCPVCVTGSGYIEQAILLSYEPGVIITTFGDLLKVPGIQGTLAEARANGGNIRIVYSPLDAVELARLHPNQQVIFLGVGFETTAPIIALAVRNSKQKGITNFSVLPALKILRPALETLLSDPEFKIDGLIAPGHLSVIIGGQALKFLPEKYKLPTVITGFRMEELWTGIGALLKQIQKAEVKLENMYSQVVTEQGNIKAQELLYEIFLLEDAEWRGLGLVADSGFGFREDYQIFDARLRFQRQPIPSQEPPGCMCGVILLGKAEPEDCPHFNKGCRPEHPIGPCMVSSEGTCGAHYYYRN